ncbi:type IV toxin-antitoxin system AbiEi family antitoxin domain-containing protein [Gordonia sp. (in: high G+C Gram-positive bacteria)]|uniref:type IV toxin-antitoxin system AbiEi family antitoxin domain-containing protein n=1 Tax=Gordonia sp. (in: high G+C Gram-positive bacteria) TaxID=84139 RepID=UPI003C73328C
MEYNGEIAQLLAARDGVVTTAQALECGLTRRQIARRVDQGDWVPMARAIFRSAAHPLTEAVLVRAAVLAHRGVADRTTAAWWHGMLPNLPHQLTIAAPNRIHPGRWRFGDVDLSRRFLHPVDVVEVRGLSVTSLPATAVFAAVALDDGTRFLDRVLQQGRVRVDELVSMLERYAGTIGMPEARELVRIASEDSESEAERLFVRLLREAGITGWVQQYRFGRWRLDFAWPELQVAVEIDGWAFHYQHDRFGSDRAKLNALEDAKWRKKVYTWHMLNEKPTETIEEVAALLSDAAESR